MDNSDALQEKLIDGVYNEQQETDLLVVGIGASAGGVEALQKFFERVSPRSGMAYVVILHVSPDHDDGQLAGLLQQTTPVPVIKVAERIRIEADHIYVIPPGQHISIEGDAIVVAPVTTVEDRRAPVDIFFRTLAESHGPRAICVVLSGTGASGSMGLKRIKERGGAVFVQTPADALYNEMPRNAIATELVDEVLSVDQLPQKILRYKENLFAIQLPPEITTGPENQQEVLYEIFSRLNSVTGHDFSQYKRPTMLRRLERRIYLHNLSGLPAYANFIREHPEELDGLHKDLLISVTNFFRDKKAFEELEATVIRKLYEEKADVEAIRIWVAGCATGEEAYSLAMLCAEHASGHLKAPRVQIFATDIDERAIQKARNGLYTLNDAADVSPERLQRFFQPEGEYLRIRREICDMILFARHNLIKDPPFIQVDLISCRNVMIYLDRTVQEKLLKTFHFSLNSKGHLFLGNSESIDGAALFHTVSTKRHIYQSKPGKHRFPGGSESVPLFRIPPSPGRSTIPANVQTGEASTLSDLHLRLRDEFTAPSVLVNEQHEIIHVSNEAGKYLRFAGGESTLNLVQLVQDNLRFELRSALYEATRQQREIAVYGLQINTGNKPEILNLFVRPVIRPGNAAHGLILVIFQSAVGERENPQQVSSSEPLVKRMEEENNRLATQLRSTNEQHELQEEELTASNEELQAMVEELRSATEELETGKEELQAINEELSSVNHELKLRVKESTLASNNLHNLINSTNIGTIFLDHLFRVVLFTPAARGIFNLMPADYGRSISDITTKLEYYHLIRDAEKVLDTLQVIEREVKTTDGQVFLMRLLPYIADKGQVGGVVITFVDILERTRESEGVQRRLEIKYQALFNSIDEGFCVIEMLFNEQQEPVDFRFLEVNAAFERQTGIGDARGKRMREIVPEHEESWFRIYGRVARTGEPVRFENRAEQLGHTYDVYAFRTGEPEERKVAVLFTNITERKRLEQQKEDFISIASHELKTPLTSIRAYTEFLLEEFVDTGDAESVSLLEKLEKQINRLTKLVHDMFDTTQISEGKMNLRLAPLDLNELISEQLAALQHLSNKHRLIYHLRDNALVRADRERIGQVLTNLISNAVKYSPQGGDVTIWCTPEGDDKIAVHVQDTGLGIPPEQQARVFDRFFRVGNKNTENLPGMGLGLYITGGIVQRHGGTIRVESKENKGSTFIFTLPL